MGILGLNRSGFRQAHRRLAGITLNAGQFVLDALEQALHERRPLRDASLVHHSDRGSQYVSTKYTERLAEAGIEPSVGSVGDSYDNALAETVIGLFKTEIISRRGPWRSLEAVEFATLEWVDWYNNRRLLEPIGNIPPAEAETRFYAQSGELAMGALYGSPPVCKKKRAPQKTLLQRIRPVCGRLPPRPQWESLGCVPYKTTRMCSLLPPPGLAHPGAAGM